MADTQTEAMPPVGKWAPAVALAWLIPGGGHFLLKRPGRGALLAASVAAMFLLGLMMRGALFHAANRRPADHRHLLSADSSAT